MESLVRRIALILQKKFKDFINLVLTYERVLRDNKNIEGTNHTLLSNERVVGAGETKNIITFTDLDFNLLIRIVIAFIFIPGVCSENRSVFLSGLRALSQGTVSYATTL